MDEKELFNSGSENGRRIPPPAGKPDGGGINGRTDNSNDVFTGATHTDQPPKNVSYNTNYNTNYYKSGRKGCLFWGLAILAAFITLNSFFFFGIVSVFSSENSYEYEETLSTDYVEILRIEGTIARGNVNGYGAPVGYKHDWMLNKIDYLISDSYNKGIILYIDSGGGGTYESDEMYLALKRYKEETGRPIYAYYGPTAASGAVYISMAADEIYANRMSMLGSIGVRMTYYNTKELMDKLGVKEISITSGRNKTMMSSMEELTDEQRAILQKSVDESFEYFVQVVSEGRGIPADSVREFADGRIYTPKEAMELGLIDGIMDYGSFIEEMYYKDEFSGCTFYEDTYTDTSIWGLLFSKIRDAGAANSEIGVLKELLNKSELPETVFE